jgi:hypothetical protein
MNKELEKLITIKNRLNKQLDIFDKRNDLFTCMQLTKKLNEIDKKIRQIATEEELEELHKEGLI